MLYFICKCQLRINKNDWGEGGIQSTQLHYLCTSDQSHHSIYIIILLYTILIVKFMVINTIFIKSELYNLLIEK